MIRLIVMDVDGTLTDGSIYYDGTGNEWKKFSVKDAAGIFAARAVGISTMILTGRASAAVERRSQDLGVDYVFQGVKDKREFLCSFIDAHGMAAKDILYIGDDFNDLSAMELTGYVGCPADAREEIRARADYIAETAGGYGAVSDVVFQMLKAQGIYEKAARDIYGDTN